MNCQLYSGWHQGNRRPGIVSDGEGLVEAAGDSIEVWSIGFRGGVRIGARERDSAPVIDLCDETFRRRQLDSVRVAAALSGKVAAMRCTRAWGARLDLVAKTRLDAKGRDDGVVISLSASLPTCVAQGPFDFHFFFPRPEPAGCA